MTLSFTWSQSPVAQPNGTQAETATEESTSIESAFASAKTYEERASAAFKSLEAGHPAHEVNRRFVETETEDPETAQGTPEEATGDPSEQPETPAKAEEEGDKPEPEDTQDIDVERMEKVLKAKRVLRRDNWTDTAMEKVDEDDLLLIAEKAETRQRESDRFSQHKQPAKPEGTGDDNRQTETDGGDESQLIEQIAEFDDELAEKVKALVGRSAKEQQETQQVLARQRLEVIVSKAKSSYPELETEAVFDKAVEKAAQLAQSPGYTNAEDAFADACALVISPMRAKSAQDQLLKSSRSERDGQVDTTTTIDDSKRAMTRDEKQSLAFKLLGQNMTPEEVRARLAKIPDAD